MRLLGAALLLLASGCGTMPRSNAALEASWQAVNYLDAKTTARIRHHDALVEGAPVARAVLGENPVRGDTARYFVAYGLLHWWVSRKLTGRWRTLWQALTLYDSAWAVETNCGHGLC